MVFIVSKLIVLKLILDFVVGNVVKRAVDKTKENRHVWVIMQWHNCPFFNEEENKSVVRLLLINCNSVQVSLIVVWVLGTFNT